MLNLAEEKKLLRAKTAIILQHPFWAVPLLITPLLSENVGTACTDCRTIKLDPKFTATLTAEELVGLLLHEVFHIVLQHPLTLTQKNIDAEIWNVAGDYFINFHLKKINIRLPEGGLFAEGELEEFIRAGAGTDAIYRRLLREQPSSGEKSANGTEGPSNGTEGPSKGPEGPSKGWDRVEAPKNEDGSALDPAEIAKLREKIISHVAQALETAKQAGKMPAGLGLFLEGLLKPKINWISALARFLTETATADYSWRHPDHYYGDGEFILPGPWSEQISGIVVAVDTSGSIKPKQYQEALTEIAQIVSLTDGVIPVLPVDFIAYPPVLLDASMVIDELVLKANEGIKGGGGTRFTPAFEHFEKCDEIPKCLIYFTDGECDSFPDIAPTYPVIWLLTEDAKPFTPPFGEVIATNL